MVVVTPMYYTKSIKHIGIINVFSFTQKSGDKHVLYYIYRAAYNYSAGNIFNVFSF